MKQGLQEVLRIVKLIFEDYPRSSFILLFVLMMLLFAIGVWAGTTPEVWIYSAWMSCLRWAARDPIPALIVLAAAFAIGFVYLTNTSDRTVASRRVFINAGGVAIFVVTFMVIFGAIGLTGFYLITSGGGWVGMGEKTIENTLVVIGVLVVYPLGYLAFTVAGKMLTLITNIAALFLKE